MLFCLSQSPQKKTEDSIQKTEVRRQEAGKVRRQKSEVRSQEAGGRESQKTEVRSQKSEGRRQGVWKVG
ncbi:MAG: hypothetical protein ILNGONEN_02109 [Syntrophorhabdaceae bacterium]|jgi:hypothetical protein|nr:hypothetical protein [Syntrophorhabdaceae bacterium]